jgi:hypothetical protein
MDVAGTSDEPRLATSGIPFFDAAICLIDSTYGCRQVETRATHRHTSPEGKMRKPILGTNVAVFILFFLISLFEAFSARNWIVAALWLACGALFLRADLPRPRGRNQR